MSRPDFFSTHRTAGFFRSGRSVLNATLKSAICGAIASSIIVLPARAQEAIDPSAPEALQRLVEQVDDAASSADLDAVMALYGDDFVHDDGLTRSSLRSSLQELWERFPDLSYSTEILAWEATPTGYVAETETTIAGTETTEHRRYQLNATLRSRQTYDNGQIVAQDVLAEETLLTSGDRPPDLTVNLPERVAPDSEYAFDVIVREPLGDDFLLGTAIQENVSVENYLNETALELELLNAGGLFKLGQTEAEAGDYWVSGAIVREGGIAIVTRRMQVEP